MRTNTTIMTRTATMPLAACPEGDPRTSRLVFITRDLPRFVIEEVLRAFQAAVTQ